MGGIPVLPNEYLGTKFGEPFLMFDSGEGNPKRMFIFDSKIGIRFFSESEHWFSGGTFRVCLEVFFQVHTVHAQQRGKFFSIHLWFISKQD